MFADSSFDQNIPERKEQVACIRMTQMDKMLNCTYTKYYVMPSIVIYTVL